MHRAAFYLGPAGDLRPLPSPDNGVERPVSRFGGTHEALSGARTMDTTGHRATYTLDIPAVTPELGAFLDGLYYGTVAGPLYLLDPLSPNLLPRMQAQLAPFQAGLVVTSGGLARVDETAPARVPVAALEWSAYTPPATLRFAWRPVLPGEDITVSVLARAVTSGTVATVLTIEDRQGHTAMAEAEATVTDQWQRCHVTTTLDRDARRVQVSVSARSGAAVRVAAAQLEYAGTPTEWNPNAGCVPVVIDQIDRDSPQYPYTDTTVTLLET